MNYIPLSHSLAAEVRAEIARQRISLDKLSDSLPISKSTLQRRLSGEYPLNTDELAQISAALNVDPSILISRATQPGAGDAA